MSMLYRIIFAAAGLAGAGELALIAAVIAAVVWR